MGGIAIGEGRQCKFRKGRLRKGRRKYEREGKKVIKTGGVCEERQRRFKKGRRKYDEGKRFAKPKSTIT